MRICILKKIKNYGFQNLIPVCRRQTSERDDHSTSKSLVYKVTSKICCFRRLLCCVCMPVLLTVCVFVYITLSVCLSMTSLQTVQESLTAAYTINGKFTAPGLEAGPVHAAHPKGTFWRSQLNPNKTGLWNRLQYKLDLFHSLVLRPGKGRPLSFQKPVPMLARTAVTACVFSPASLEKALPDFHTLPFRIKEFISRMLCQDYALITDQPGLCDTGPGKAGGTRPFLLLAIKSQDEHYEQRRVIRDTWGKTGQLRGRKGKGGLVRRVFLLGKSGIRPNHTQEELLNLENARYGDLLRWDFKDTFFNLTLKDVLFWHWLALRCPHAHFVFKGDDDVFLQTPALLDYLQERVEKEEKKAAAVQKHDRQLESFIVGDVIPLAQPIRSKDNKYYIPESLYTGTYPTYTGGGGVVYSGALALRLQAVSPRVHLFPIDDVYVGMCLERLGVIPTHEPAFLTFDFPDGEEELPCAYHSILLVHKRSPEVVRRLWAEVLEPPAECHNTSLRVEPEPKKKPKEDKDPPKAKPNKSVKKHEIDIMDFM
ncbi:hypothetical protein ACEWY4_015528 [Coilia grayii]|uniref:Hexosyltransferase n=1 Tax=Coilia grayii TaxID=363190 RepID=A0ABD1JP69_9TELE